jgi:hypothetical protein
MTLVLPLFMGAQDQSPAVDEPVTSPEKDVFAIRTALVTVTNETGFPLNGLEAKDFEVLETEISRDIVEVLGDDEGREIFLLVDTSAGFQGNIPSLRKGLQAFAAALREPHEVMLVEFGGRPRHLAGPTSDRYQLDRAARKVMARSEGAYLADAIADVTSGITASKQDETQPPMIVIVASLTSDFSTRRFTEAYDLAVQSRAEFYVVRYENGFRGSFNSQQVEDVLRGLCERSGGAFTRVLAAGALEKTLGNLATQLLQPRYRISFLTEVEPRTMMEDLNITVFREHARTLLLQLLPYERHVTVSHPTQEGQ